MKPPHPPPPRPGAAPPASNRLFVDFVAGEPSEGCADAVQASFGGIPEAGGALSRFGLDIGRETSGWADGADAVRGHENFFEGTPMLIFHHQPAVVPAGSAPDPAFTNT